MPLNAYHRGSPLLIFEILQKSPTKETYIPECQVAKRDNERRGEHESLMFLLIFEILQKSPTKETYIPGVELQRETKREEEGRSLLWGGYGQ